MARRTFEMIEVYVHWFAGRSQVQISESLGRSRRQTTDPTRLTARIGS